MEAGFTTRYAGRNVYETAVALAQATFPATRHANQPGAITLARADSKPELMAAVSVIHHPVDAPILFTEQSRLPPETRAALERFRAFLCGQTPTGVPFVYRDSIPDAPRGLLSRRFGRPPCTYWNRGRPLPSRWPAN